MSALITHTPIPTIISVGRWIAAVILENDISNDAIQKKIESLINALSLCLNHRKSVAIAIAAETAAWSDGNGSDGRWDKIRFSLFETRSSGLAFSPKNWITILTTAAIHALKNIHNAASL